MTLPRYTAGAGIPLVALHGFLGRGSDWADLSARLPGIWLVAPDLPGHGDALGLPDSAFSMEGAAAAVLDTLDACGIERAALLGYSMGGRLALYLALHAPDRFTHVVLESASPGLRTEAERAQRRHVDAERAAEIQRDLSGFLERWYAMPLFAITPAATRQALVQARRANSPTGLARSLAGMGTGAQPALWEKLPHLSVPALALAGASDPKFVRIAREMAALNPRIRIEAVPGAGHTAHTDAPKAFAYHVRRFLHA